MRKFSGISSFGKKLEMQKQAKKKTQKNLTNTIFCVKFQLWHKVYFNKYHVNKTAVRFGQ